MTIVAHGRTYRATTEAGLLRLLTTLTERVLPFQRREVLSSAEQRLVEAFRQMPARDQRVFSTLFDKFHLAAIERRNRHAMRRRNRRAKQGPVQ